MLYNKDPRRSGDQHWGYHQLSVGTIGICSTHLFDLFPLLFDALQVCALDVDRIERIAGGGFSRMASEDLASVAVHHGDVLMGDIAPPIIALKVRRLQFVGQDSAGSVDRLQGHGVPLFVRGLVSAAVVNMLGVVRVVAGTITTKFMGMRNFVVVVFTGMVDANRAGLLGGFVMMMGIVSAQVAFLGMGIKDLFVPFHVVHMLTKNLPVGAISHGTGRNDHSGFSQSGMARSLDGPSADGAVVGNFQDFRDGLHGFPFLVGCARKWAVSAGRRHTISVRSLGGETSGR